MKTMRLNQVLATREDAKGKTASAKTELTQVYQKKAEAFNGNMRTYESYKHDGEKVPPTRQNVAARVPDIMRQLDELFRDHWAIEHRMNAGNQFAKADIIVDGRVLMAAVPAAQLLFLASQLQDIRTVVSNIPVLDEGEKWSWDDALSLWRSDPVLTTRTQKVQKGIVLHAPTDKHPAQTQLITEDQNVGEYTSIKFSGAIPRGQQAEFVRRVDKLARAVKTAREQANMVEVEEVDVSALTNFLFESIIKNKAN